MAECYFCGTNKSRTQKGLNIVAFRIKHPNAGLIERLCGKDWKYACQDCAMYMLQLYGRITFQSIERNSQMEEQLWQNIK